MKRAFDFLFALIGILVLWPIFLLISLFIVIFDGLPVFFRQERVGINGRPFTLLKFRSMKNSAPGKLITVGGDARITPLGKLLRKTKLDELPQLINVFKGEMSFVGPRPEVKKYVDLYSPGLKEVLRLKPGITDPASLIYYNESEVLEKQSDPEHYYVDILMPEKIRVNLLYAKKSNFFFDLGIILMTVLRVLGLRIDIMSKIEGTGQQEHGQV